MGMFDPMDKVINDLKQKRNDEVSRSVIASMQKELVGALKPVFDEMTRSLTSLMREHHDAITESLKNVQVSAPEIPEIKVPDVHIPEFKIPTPIVNVKPADVHFPDIPAPEKFDGNVHLASHGVDYKKPMPVLLVNADGKPYVAMTMNAGGGGSRGPLLVQNILSKDGVSVIDSSTPASPAVRVALTGNGSLASALIDSSGVQYSGSNPVPITIVSGSSSGTQYNDSATPDQAGGTGTLALAVQDASGSVFSVKQGNGVADKALRVVHATDVAMSVNIVSGSTAGTQYNDSATPDQSGGVLTLAGAFDGSGSVFSLRNGTGVSDKALRVVHAADVATSVNITAGSIANTGFNITGQDENSGPVSATTLRVVQAVDVGTSVNVTNVGGTAVDTNTGASSAGTLRVVFASNSLTSTQTLTDAIAGSDQPGGMDFNLGFNGSTWDRLHTNSGDSAGALRTTPATDAVTSVQFASQQVTLQVQQVSGANDSVTVTGATGTIMVVGDIQELTADNNEAPVKVGGVSRSTLPTNATDGNRRSVQLDLAGRVVTTPSPRELVSQNLVLLTTGAETSILTQVASTFLDLVSITAINQSGSAWPVKLNESSTGGNVYTLMVPANDTRGIVFQVPFKQSTAGNDWTATLVGSDISNSNLTIVAQAVQRK